MVDKTTADSTQKMHIRVSFVDELVTVRINKECQLCHLIF